MNNNKDLVLVDIWPQLRSICLFYIQTVYNQNFKPSLKSCKSPIQPELAEKWCMEWLLLFPLIFAAWRPFWYSILDFKISILAVVCESLRMINGQIVRILGIWRQSWRPSWKLYFAWSDFSKFWYVFFAHLILQQNVEKSLAAIFPWSNHMCSRLIVFIFGIRDNGASFATACLIIASLSSRPYNVHKI